MHRTFRKTLIAALVLLVGVSAYAASGYHVVRKLPLAGDEGWDYLTVDSIHHRLYASRGTHVMVIDLDTDKQVGTIPDTP